MTTQDQVPKQDPTNQRSSLKLPVWLEFRAGVGMAVTAMVIIVLIATGVLMAVGVLSRPAQAPAVGLDLVIGDVSPSVEAPQVEFNATTPVGTRSETTAGAEASASGAATPIRTPVPTAVRTISPAVAATPTPAPTPAPTPTPPPTCQATVVDYGYAEFFKSDGAGNLVAFGHTAIYNARPNFPGQTVLAAIKHPQIKSGTTTTSAYQVYSGTYAGIYIKTAHIASPNYYWKIAC